MQCDQCSACGASFYTWTIGTLTKIIQMNGTNWMFIRHKHCGDVLKKKYLMLYKHHMQTGLEKAAIARFSNNARALLLAHSARKMPAKLLMYGTQWNSHNSSGQFLEAFNGKSCANCTDINVVDQCQSFDPGARVRRPECHVSLEEYGLQKYSIDVFAYCGREQGLGRAAYEGSDELPRE
jgi:hypothetical protein